MRRIYSLLIVLLIAVFVLSACGSPTAAPTENLPAATEAQPAAPAAEEKVLTIINPVIDKDWSPLRGGGWNVRWLSMWWAPPVWADRQGTLNPMVFESWSSSPDFKTWTFKIDPKAVFSDGSPITADDVKGTWELCTQPLTKHQRVSLFLSAIVGYDEAVAGNATTLPGIVVKDASTVEVTLKAPDPIFVNRIATNLIGPVKISQARGADGQEIVEWWNVTNKPAVSGPYMPSAMNLETGEVEFVPNPNWWGPAPKLSKWIYKTVEDPATAILMLKEGDADINMGADQPTTYAELGPGYVGTNEPSDPIINMFWINNKIAPMDDINCRKALVMAADPAKMFEAAFPHGPGEPATTLLRPLLGDKDTNQPNTNNPDGAKAAFEQCKYKAAMPKLYLAGVSGGQTEAAAQVLVEQWRQVLGITAYEFISAYDKLTPADQAKVQLFRDDVGTRVFDVPSMLLGSIHSGSGNAKSKMGGYVNEQVDQLIDQALTLPFDDPNRVALSLEAEKLATDEFVWIPWNVTGPLTHGMPWVVGLKKNLDWQVMEPWNLDIDLTKRP